MGKVIIATGIPGSGKTTLLAVARERTRTDFTVTTFGTIMLKLAREKGLAEHRDELRKLPEKTQRELQEQAAKKIAEMAKQKTIVVDTHCTIKTPAGYLPGLPEWVLRNIKPDVIVLVESYAREIVRRRNYDESRMRDAETEEEIQLQQELNRANAVACSVLTGATLRIVENHDNRLDVAARDMAKIIEK